MQAGRIKDRTFLYRTYSKTKLAVSLESARFKLKELEDQFHLIEQLQDQLTAIDEAMPTTSSAAMERAKDLADRLQEETQRIMRMK